MIHQPPYVVVSGENPSNILGWLALSELNGVGVQIDSMASKAVEALNESSISSGF